MHEESDAPVLLDIDEGIARLTLNRPSRLNAIDGGVQVALRAALDQIEGNPQIRALILTGAGRAFCAGQDLGERAAMLADGDVDLHASLEENYNPLIRRLAALPCPIIAAVNGMAAGAGAALAIGCDIVLAARSARFQFAFAKLGLGPDSGASWLLPRLVGQGRAMALALTAEPVDAVEAVRIGLAWKLVEDAELMPTAARIAQMCVSSSRPALTAIRQQLRTSWTLSFDAALDMERDAQGLLGRSPEYREAVVAFISRRSPGFE